MNDKDVNTPGEGTYQWRSEDVERQRTLEISGVFEAARHPRHGQAANLRKTLVVCIIALAAAGVMVAGGLLTQDATTLPERPALVADAPGAATAAVAPESAPAAAAASSEAVTARQPRLDLAALSVLNEPETAAAEPNRADCEAISGTPYESESERIWFLANCIKPEPVVAFLAAPELSGAVVQPAAATLSGPAGVSADEAITTSIDWITNRQDAVYDVASDSCSASEVGELWLVSCESSLTGCGGEICTSWVSVCVTDDGAVLANRNC